MIHHHHTLKEEGEESQGGVGGGGEGKAIELLSDCTIEGLRYMVDFVLFRSSLSLFLSLEGVQKLEKGEG